MKTTAMHSKSRVRRPAAVFASLVWTSGLALVAVGQLPAEAAVSTVKGYACGYYTNVGLFGGPQTRMGCPPNIVGGAPISANSVSPAVELPPTGSATAITAQDADGAKAQYGPAVIFGGIWPEHVGAGPRSGPITVSTQGTPAGGTVTASAEITLFSPPNADDPGGFGPMPVWGDSLRVECTATENSRTGSTTFVNAFHAPATDPDGGPINEEPIPANPPPNYTRHGVITNVGDVFTAVYNEQIINPDGSLTVNAVHMYLYGPVAVGEIVKGQVTCGTTPTTATGSDTSGPVCGIPVVAPVGPDDPAPKVPRQELLGTHDTRGIQSISGLQVTNGTIQVGAKATNDPTTTNDDYLVFIPGQKGPLTFIATRADESRPMTWSFNVTDTAGNTSHCRGVVAGTTISSTNLETGQQVTVSSVSVGNTITPYQLRISTRAASCPTGAPIGGTVLSTASFTLPNTSRTIPFNMTSGDRWVCWVSAEDPSDFSTPQKVVIF